jgi:tetratricopeptide (TPR) repeat protein
LLLVFEDLHWIDSETQVLLDSLVESLPTARLLLLVNYRPEYDHPWGKKTYYTQLRIDPLPPESAEMLLAALLGEDAGLAPLKRLLLERTEGNPFFLEESVQTLSETKALVGERGAYSLARLVEDIQVPATVQAVLAARIDRLPAEEKSLLQVAAVLGETVPLGLLHAVAETSEERLRPALAHLRTTEFLYEASLFPDLEYTFKHGLTYQVAYNSLLLERRCALHARVVEMIERLGRDRVTEHVDRLAHHALRGEVWEKALGYLRLAGAKALARSANTEAAALYEQALTVVPHILESRATREHAIDLRFELRQALQALGEHRRVLDYLGEAETLATTLGDQRRLAWVSAYLSQYYVWMGEGDRGLTAGERALAIAEQLGDFGLRVLTNFFLAQGANTLGDYRRAMNHNRMNVEALTGDLARERFGLSGLASVNSLNALARSLAEVGEFGEAQAYASDAMRIAESVGQPYSLVSAHTLVGNQILGEIVSQGDARDASEAEACYREALTLAQELGMRPLVAHCHHGLAKLYHRAGKRERAQEHSTTATSMYREMEMTYWLEKAAPR